MLDSNLNNNKYHLHLLFGFIIIATVDFVLCEFD